MNYLISHFFLDFLSAERVKGSAGSSEAPLGSQTLSYVEMSHEANGDTMQEVPI
ncbi:MAG: hypothetical protein ABSE72_11560 [Bacteroidales bacterium]